MFGSFTEPEVPSDSLVASIEVESIWEQDLASLHPRTAADKKRPSHFPDFIENGNAPAWMARCASALFYTA
jgi:hypothetical protein